MEVVGTCEADCRYIRFLLGYLPAKDLQELRKIILLDLGSKQPFPQDPMYILRCGRLFHLNQEVGGVYTRRGFHCNTIHLTVSGIDRFIVYHEIGHHVMSSRPGLRARVHDLMLSWARSSGEVDIAQGLAKRAGLRTYSFASAEEFLADVYAILHTGRPGQAEALEAFWQTVAPGEPSLGELFEKEELTEV